MKYDSEIYDCCLELMRFAHKQLLENERPMMASEIGRWIDESETQFIHNAPAFGQLVTLIMGEYAVTKSAQFRDFNEDEKEASLAAVEGRGPRATSTQEALAAVKAAHKRLAKAERMRPFTEARARLDEKRAAAAEKRRAMEEVQAERDRPAQELKVAEKDLKQAEAEAKKVEVEAGK